MARYKFGSCCGGVHTTGKVKVMLAVRNRTRSVATRIGNALGIYGDYASQMEQGSKLRSDVRDRAAYVYITGQFPSHLRSNMMGILRAVTASFQRPVSLDGRSGTIKLTSDVVNDLELEKHPMVIEVRAKINEGYMIQPSRGLQTRKPFSKVFMHRPKRGAVDLITVNSDGSVKRGWN